MLLKWTLAKVIIGFPNDNANL